MWLEARRRGRILDVGCGNGQFLAHMHDLGWEVMGVEPDPEAVRIAWERFRVKVFLGSINKANFHYNYFDAITMNHVIEHVSNPVEVLKECYRLLKPGGKMILLTPNIESLGHRLFKKLWLYLDPPIHFCLFSPRTIQMCAELGGLLEYKVKTVASGVQIAWLLSLLIQREYVFPVNLQRRLSWWLRLEGYLYYGLEHLLINLYPLGEEILMIAYKKKEK